MDHLVGADHYLKWEQYRSVGDGYNSRLQCVWYDPATGKKFDYTPMDKLGTSFHISDDARVQPQPSSRAALVLSAVGCEWREGSR